jgi:hypothetical protein
MATAYQLIVFFWFLYHVVGASSHVSEEHIACTFRMTESGSYTRQSGCKEVNVSVIWERWRKSGQSELSSCPSHSSDWPDVLHLSHITNTIAYSHPLQHPCEPDYPEDGSSIFFQNVTTHTYKGQAKSMDLRLFHTFPTAQTWQRLISGCSKLSRYISEAIVSHVTKKFKLLRQNSFENSLKNSAPTGSKNLFSTGSVYQTSGGLHGNMRYRNKVQNLSYILRFVAFQYLVWV